MAGARVGRKPFSEHLVINARQQPDDQIVDEYGIEEAEREGLDPAVLEIESAVHEQGRHQDEADQELSLLGLAAGDHVFRTQILHSHRHQHDRGG